MNPKPKSQWKNVIKFFIILFAIFYLMTIFMDILHPRTKAPQSYCRAQIKKIEVILFTYREEYGAFPNIESKEFMSFLSGKNKRRSKYFNSPDEWEKILIDPWKIPLNIKITDDSVLIRSAGPNKKFYDDDDIIDITKN